MAIPKHRRGDKYEDPCEYNGKMQWDLGELAAAMHLSLEETKAYFRDGRRSGFLVEKRIVKENSELRAAPKNMTHDVQNGDEKWEVRTITDNGISFIPAVNRGGGRRFDETKFEQKLQDVAGFIVCDVSTFPDVAYWSIPSRVIARWHHRNIMSGGGFSYKKGIKLIKELHERDQDDRH